VIGSGGRYNVCAFEAEIVVAVVIQTVGESGSDSRECGETGGEGRWWSVRG
jgi:hypothetical protein